jgi:hypothetical protein
LRQQRTAATAPIAPRPRAVAVEVSGIRATALRDAPASWESDALQVLQPGAIMSLSVNIYLNALGNSCDRMYL